MCIDGLKQIWYRILNLISFDGPKTSCALMDPFLCFPSWNLMSFVGPKNLMFFDGPCSLICASELLGLPTVVVYSVYPRRGRTWLLATAHPLLILCTVVAWVFVISQSNIKKGKKIVLIAKVSCSLNWSELDTLMMSSVCLPAIHAVQLILFRL